MPHGQGAYSFSNGDRYVGGFENSTRSGYGIYTYTDGEEHRGEWKNDEIVGIK
jgi:hypothetical protein